MSEYQALDEGRKNFIVGIDNCLCKTITSSSPSSGIASLTAKEVLAAEEIEGARDWINSLVEQGHQVCFLTERPERLRKATTTWLKEHGFSYTVLIMDKPAALTYHYVDDRHVQATTFKGRYGPLVRKERTIEIFR